MNGDGGVGEPGQVRERLHAGLVGLGDTVGDYGAELDVSEDASDGREVLSLLLEKGEGSFLGSKNSIILRFFLYILLHRGIVWCAGSFLIPPLNFVDTEP